MISLFEKIMVTVTSRCLSWNDCRTPIHLCWQSIQYECRYYCGGNKWSLCCSNIDCDCNTNNVEKVFLLIQFLTLCTFPVVRKLFTIISSNCSGIIPCVHVIRYNTLVTGLGLETFLITLNIRLRTRIHRLYSFFIFSSSFGVQYREYVNWLQ